MSPLDARLLNFVLGTGLAVTTGADSAAGSATAAAFTAGASAEPTLCVSAAAEAPAGCSDETRVPVDSETTLGVVVAPLPPECWETGLVSAGAERAVPCLEVAVSALPGLVLDLMQMCAHTIGALGSQVLRLLLR